MIYTIFYNKENSLIVSKEIYRLFTDKKGDSLKVSADQFYKISKNLLQLTKIS